MKFKIYSESSNNQYIKEFKNEDEAKTWVVNRLDLSLNWIVLKVK